MHISKGQIQQTVVTLLRSYWPGQSHIVYFHDNNRNRLT